MEFAHILHKELNHECNAPCDMSKNLEEILFCIFANIRSQKVLFSSLHFKNALAVVIMCNTNAATDSMSHIARHLQLDCVKQNFVKWAFCALIIATLFNCFLKQQQCPLLPKLKLKCCHILQNYVLLLHLRMTVKCYFPIMLLN